MLNYQRDPEGISNFNMDPCQVQRLRFQAAKRRGDHPGHLGFWARRRAAPEKAKEGSGYNQGHPYDMHIVH